MDFEFRAFEPNKYDAGRLFWHADDGVGLNSANTRAEIAAILARNPDLSLVATRGTTNGRNPPVADVWGLAKGSWL